MFLRLPRFGEHQTLRPFVEHQVFVVDQICIYLLENSMESISIKLVCDTVFAAKSSALAIMVSASNNTVLVIQKRANRVVQESNSLCVLAHVHSVVSPADTGLAAQWEYHQSSTSSSREVFSPSATVRLLQLPALPSAEKKSGFIQKT